MAQKEKETESFYNAGADDYNPLLFVVFFIFAAIAVWYVGAEIYHQYVRH